MHRLFILLLVSIALAQDSNKVCFHTDKNYSGTELCAIEGEAVDVYQNHLDLNDQFSSVQVPVGLQVIAFFDDGFHGYSRVFQESTPDLGSFSDRISSFIVQRARACFYTGKQYSEVDYCVSVGDMVDLPMEPVLNNNIASVKIPAGLLVKVFTDDGFQGRFTWITTDTADLGDFNDRITSIIVEYDNSVCFYTDTNYMGTSYCAKPGEAHDIWKSGNLNDEFSSVRVPHDIFVKAYSDDNYHGWSRMFIEDVPNLNDFNDRITSFVVGFSGAACFYTEIYWEGNQFCTPYGDKIDIEAHFNSFNDKFQSIIVPDDIQVKAFKHSGYKGEMISYNTVTRAFGAFSKTISSFEVTAAITTPYDNFADPDVMVFEKITPFNVTVCSFISSQGTWKLSYNDSCRSVSKRYACNNIYSPNIWHISSGSGVVTNGASVCQSEFGSDFAFGTPMNAHSNSLLSGLVPSGGAWINLYYDAFTDEYSHRAKRSTECGGANQRACTSEDSYFQSWICSLPVVSLFGCREPYCHDGITRVKMDNVYICKCPTNHRLKRGLYDQDKGACALVTVVQRPLTGEEIVRRLLANRFTRDILARAWMMSFISRNLFQERGGWIFANPNNPNDLQVVLAPSSASRPFRPNEEVNPAIDLEGSTSANANSGWVLVANFHTHPLEANQEPSSADLRNSILRGVPGIVISRRHIYVYGPESRANLHPLGDPRAYPNDGDPNDFNPNARGSVRAVKENPFPRPHDEL